MDSSSNTVIPEDAPAPRLCHLFKWPDFDGYGFNLHGEKSKPGQYIGKVDKDSPSELAGMKANDRIIEVNGTNIANENHKQVVQRIKAIPNETKLLVVDDKTEQYYKARNIPINSAMANVLVCKTPVPRPMPNNNSDELNDDSIISPPNGNGSHHSDEDRKSHVSDSGSGSSLPSKTDSLKKDSRNGFNSETSSPGPSPTPPGSSAPSPSPTPILSKTSSNPLDLNMTAQEMRALLAARKKEKMDPKNQKMDLRKKYDIIQTL